MHTQWVVSTYPGIWDFYGSSSDPIKEEHRTEHLSQQWLVLPGFPGAPFALPTNRSSVVCCSLWLVCSHTAGRVWGACRVQPDLHRVAALTWLDTPFGPTHPDVGCMTARRCAKVLAGGFQVSWLACCEGRPDIAAAPWWLAIVGDLCPSNNSMITTC